MRQKLHLVALVLALILGRGASPHPPTAQAATAADEDAAYTRTITERADKIVAPLTLDDAAKAARVRELIVAQYRGLHDIHAARDAKIAQSKGGPSGGAVAEAWRSVARNDADLKLYPLHRRFVAQLEA